MMIELKQGDCIEVLATLPENSIDACVTDPPYGLGVVKDVAGLVMEWLNDRDGHEHVGGAGFMGRDWDKSVPSPRMWRSLYRVLKPGAYALVFAGSRTSDLMGLALRLAGVELVDSIFWTFGAGFPKGADVGKMLNKVAGVEREVVGQYLSPDGCVRDPKNRNKRELYGGYTGESTFDITAPATPDAQLWDGYRSQLKPAHEPILVARKPLEGTIAQNALKWGTAGAFNIEACRVGTDWEIDPGKRLNGKIERGSKTKHVMGSFAANPGPVTWKPTPSGRYPANLILQHAHDCDESECGCSCPVRLMGEQSGVSVSKQSGYNFEKASNGNPVHITNNIKSGIHFSDTGTAARYFTQIRPDPFIYSGKATKKDRTCNGAVTNAHPTVKPRALIKHLIKLIMPPSPDAVVIDPSGGSGTTGVAAKELGRNAILIEREAEYIELIRDRLDATKPPDTEQLNLL